MRTVNRLAWNREYCFANRCINGNCVSAMGRKVFFFDTGLWILFKAENTGCAQVCAGFARRAREYVLHLMQVH